MNDDQINLAPPGFAAYNSEPPPAPKLKSAGIVSLDITEQFINAAKRRLMHVAVCGSRADNLFPELELGELVKDPHFTLFESVGALEVRFSLESLVYRDGALKMADYGSKDG